MKVTNSEETEVFDPIMCVLEKDSKYMRSLLLPDAASRMNAKDLKDSIRGKSLRPLFHEVILGMMLN